MEKVIATVAVVLCSCGSEEGSVVFANNVSSIRTPAPITNSSTVENTPSSVVENAPSSAVENTPLPGNWST